MKKIILFYLLILFSFYSAQSQIFRNARTLSPGNFMIGIDPALHSNTFGLFLQGAAGLTGGVDLGIHYGYFPNASKYIGADLNWRLTSGKLAISLKTGAHNFGNFGLDGAVNLSFPVSHSAYLFTGFDSDINFNKSDPYLIGWVPVGVQLYLKKHLAFILEAEIDVTDNSYHIFDGGFAVYF